MWNYHTSSMIIWCLWNIQLIFREILNNVHCANAYWIVRILCCFVCKSGAKCSNLWCCIIFNCCLFHLRWSSVWSKVNDAILWCKQFFVERSEHFQQQLRLAEAAAWRHGAAAWQHGAAAWQHGAAGRQQSCKMVESNRCIWYTRCE